MAWIEAHGLLWSNFSGQRFCRAKPRAPKYNRVQGWAGRSGLEQCKQRGLPRCSWAAQAALPRGGLQGGCLKGAAAQGGPFPCVLFWTALRPADGVGRGCCGDHPRHFSGLQSDSCCFCCPVTTALRGWCPYSLQRREDYTGAGKSFAQVCPKSKSAPGQLSLAYVILLLLRVVM